MCGDGGSNSLEGYALSQLNAKPYTQSVLHTMDGHKRVPIATELTKVFYWQTVYCFQAGGGLLMLGYNRTSGLPSITIRINCLPVKRGPA
jgi:hypothetical protein